MSITQSTKFIIVETGEYPLSLAQIRTRHPNISFGTSADAEFFAALGYAVVEQTPIITGDVVYESSPAIIDGKYVQTWAARAFIQEELDSQLAERRNAVNAAIDEALNKTLEIGAAFEFDTVGIKHIQMRTQDRVNIAGLKQAAEYAISKNLPDKIFRIRTYENIVVEVMAVDLVEMAWSYLDTFSTVMEAAWNLKDRATHATTVEELPLVPETL